MPVWFRQTLSVAVLLNLAGSLLLLPPLGFGRSWLGFPESHPIYLYLISFWIALFALFFLKMLLENRLNQDILLLSLLGKLSFVGLLFILRRQLGFFAVLAGFPDLILAALFFVMLRQAK